MGYISGEKLQFKALAGGRSFFPNFFLFRHYRVENFISFETVYNMYIRKNNGFRVILQNAGVIVSIFWFLPILINKAKWSKIELKIDIKSIKMVQIT